MENCTGGWIMPYWQFCVASMCVFTAHSGTYCTSHWGQSWPVCGRSNTLVFCHFICVRTKPNFLLPHENPERPYVSATSLPKLSWKEFVKQGVVLYTGNSGPQFLLLLHRFWWDSRVVVWSRAVKSAVSESSTPVQMCRMQPQICIMESTWETHDDAWWCVHKFYDFMRLLLQHLFVYRRLWAKFLTCCALNKQMLCYVYCITVLNPWS